MLLRSLLPVLAACAIAAQAAARDIHKRRARRALMQRLSRALVATVSIAGATTLVAPAAQAVEVPAAAPVMAELLFVQSASGVEIGAGGRTLTLKGLSPTTLFFSDRPVRIAGHYRTEEYLQFWKDGPDSFLKDPPNATLSAFQKGKDELSDVVVTLRNPRVSGADLTYDIAVISGKLLRAGVGPVSLFIDIIGLPFTPLSFAGVARRTAYRTVVWGGAAAASAAAASAYAYPYYYPAPAPGRLPRAGTDGTRDRVGPGAPVARGESDPGRRGGEAEGAQVAAEPGPDQRGAVPGGVAEAATADRSVTGRHMKPLDDWPRGPTWAAGRSASGFGGAPSATPGPGVAGARGIGW